MWILIESEPFTTIVFKTFCHVICPSRERNQLIKAGELGSGNSSVLFFDLITMDGFHPDS
jgi:hypothetical protein